MPGLDGSNSVNSVPGTVSGQMGCSLKSTMPRFQGRSWSECQWTQWKSEVKWKKMEKEVWRFLGSAYSWNGVECSLRILHFSPSFPICTVTDLTMDERRYDSVNCQYIRWSVARMNRILKVMASEWGCPGRFRMTVSSDAPPALKRGHTGDIIDT